MLTPCIITRGGGASEVLLSFNGPVVLMVSKCCQVHLGPEAASVQSARGGGDTLQRGSVRGRALR